MDYIEVMCGNVVVHHLNPNLVSELPLVLEGIDGKEYVVELEKDTGDIMATPFRKSGPRRYLAIHY